MRKQSQPHNQQVPEDLMFQLTHNVFYGTESTARSVGEVTQTGIVLQNHTRLLQQRVLAMEQIRLRTAAPTQATPWDVMRCGAPPAPSHRGPQPMVTREEAQDSYLQFVRGAIAEADVASSAAAQAVRYVQHLQAHVMALGMQDKRSGPELRAGNFEWLLQGQEFNEP